MGLVGVFQLFAAVNTTLQAALAAHYGNQFSVALMIVAGTVAIVVALLTGFGVEAKGVRLTTGAGTSAPDRSQRRTGI